MTYDLLVTAVSERADLFARTVTSFLLATDCPPRRIIVHEDVKPGSRAGVIAAFLAEEIAPKGIETRVIVRDPAAGMGPAIRVLLHENTTPIIFYMPEDFDFVRPVPVAAALTLMQRHEIHHIAFGKRATPAAKHPGQADEWRKEVRHFDGQALTIAQSWRSQASLWRVAVIRPFFDRLVREDAEPERWAMVKINRWMNEAMLGDVHGNDHEGRAAHLRTYLWGGIGEPQFIEHTGGDRRAEIQSIERYGAPAR